MNKHILAAVIACAIAGPAFADDDYAKQLQQQYERQFERQRQREEMNALEMDALVQRGLIESRLQQMEQKQRMQDLQHRLNQTQNMWSIR